MVSTSITIAPSWYRRSTAGDLRGDARQWPVVLDLVFETRKFLDNLLALFALLGIVAVAYGTVGVVNGLGLL